MKAILLGTAAGGGFPQWNCACPMCTAGLPPRTQDCLAISADGSSWYLINASPDIRAQILATKQLAPGPGPRETPLRGVLLTDAELDHTLGLTMLRETPVMSVWAPPAVLTALHTDFPLAPILSRYGTWTWHPITAPLTLDRLHITPIPISTKHPKYTTSSTDTPWVVAYRIHDPTTGGTLIYAPCLSTWPEGFTELAAGATCIILDGTFYSADEMSTATHTGVPTPTQRAMGHLPITGPTGTLPRIAAHPTKRWLYTHLNNTNPLLNPTSPEHAAVLNGGAEIPMDGTELNL
ncbi:MAG TPA: pyrroloquinoline quinone biosynthesis protein PqqB [Actinophytocola sp.]|uniref:pyrroloquinoline quinone biosynthesis protein PqqB n=1 Tax=Actinophytocola sp. TaxID=1872138 RepID=UPI002DDCB0CE|nr:pyrroloquinoline quinone biosynthesis protein PqqB [Actinophytocola sp.]HEV2781601.1 pyrroloquinoline quinone biosynthesis protein PqqB [Actinophytocola sp.]